MVKIRVGIMYYPTNHSANIYMRKVNKNTRAMCEIVLVFLLLTLNRFYTLSWCSIVDLEPVNTGLTISCGCTVIVDVVIYYYLQKMVEHEEAKKTKKNTLI